MTWAMAVLEAVCESIKTFFMGIVYLGAAALWFLFMLACAAIFLAVLIWALGVIF